MQISDDRKAVMASPVDGTTDVTGAVQYDGKVAIKIVDGGNAALGGVMTEEDFRHFAIPGASHAARKCSDGISEKNVLQS